MWGRTIGAVALADGREVAPLAMPLARRVYAFPQLARETFHGLPGLLADSLPDSFGNALIDAWLATRGRSPESFNAVERLCYVGTRGMGALASEVLAHRSDLCASFADDPDKADALRQTLRVGTSTGCSSSTAWSATATRAAGPACMAGHSPAGIVTT